jgi:hypothetical protein
LGIDYGSAYTKAVLVVPGGVSTLLRFDGDFALSSAVHADSGELLVGAAAWQRADSGPEGLVLSPLQAGDGPIHLAGVDVDPADLVAATLRRVAGEAASLAGGPVEDVRMVVPAGWGPRRRTWWRRVAGKAGLRQVRLVEAPVAVADRFVRDGAVVRWLVVDVGAGCEASVVRRSAGAGFEVLSTLADAGAGGDRIDAVLAEAVLGMGFEDMPASQRWALLSSVRAAKHALAEQPAVTVALPGRPSVVVNSALLRQAAQPVFERVGTLAAQAVENAEMTVDELDAVYAVGATMGVPGAAELIAAKLGVTPQVPEQPGSVAVLGAANAPSSPLSVTAAHAGPRIGLPPLRRLGGLGLPGVLSLVLYAHFVFSAEFNNGTPDRPTRYYYVLASWGELTVAATLALLSCLQAAALIGAVLHGQSDRGRQPEQGRVGTISSGIGVAAVGGMAIASLYAVTAAVYFAKPVGGLLRWATVPLLPIAACAAVLAVVAWRRMPPAGGWDRFLAFPLSSSVAAAAGTFAVAAWGLGHLPAWFNGWTQALYYGGGLLVGAALACALAGHLVVRIILTPFLGFFCIIISRSGLGILAVIYALTVAAWWGYRAWTLFRAGRTAPDGVTAMMPMDH